MAGRTPISSTNLPTDPIYWIDAFDIRSSFNDGSGFPITVTYSLIESGNTPGGDAYRTATNGEKTNIQNSLAAIGSNSGLNFLQVSGNDADILVGASSADRGGIYGITYPSTSGSTHVVAFDAPYSNANGLANNSYIYVHELLHAVGLGHSTSVFGNNDGIPNSEYTGTTLFGSWGSGWDGAPQLFDLAALQYLYGPDTSVRSGNTTYTPDLNAFSPTANNDENTLLWDGGGYDTLDFSDRTDNINVSLNPGDISQVGTSSSLILAAGTFSINYNTQIEQLISGSGNDVLTASDWGSDISGGAGNDQINGGRGNDTVTDSDGRDTVDAGDGNDRVGLISGTNVVHGGEGGDLIVGGFGNDDLSGDAGNDVIRGDISTRLFGSDTIAGGRGDDLLEGRGGVDTFVFNTGDGDDTIGALSINYNTVGNSSVTGADFVSGVDLVKLLGFGLANAAAALAKVTDVDGVATFSDLGTSITFAGLTANDLSADDFILV